MNICIIMVSGLIATLAMTLFMGLIHGLGLANADMVRAIGSLYTRSYENSFWPGVFIKFTGGAIFSIFYAILAGIAPIQTPAAIILMMTVFGLFHGLAVSIMMVVSVAEYHPLEQFRKAGLSVMVSHLAGHIVYGFFLGLFFAISNVDLKLISL